jgi:ATP-binding cassette subfamily B protein
VLDRGQIVERGTHEALLARGGLYSDLYHTQFHRQEATPIPSPFPLS